MARQWQALRPGGPETWQLVDVDVRPPAAGEVTIRVRAAGMNPADYKHVAPGAPGAEFPAAIGYEVAGEISAVGPGTRLASGPATIGQEVLAFRVQGGYAGELTVPADKVFAKPSALTHPEAANLLLTATTAAEMLEVTRVEAGETIVLHGGSGAVGLAVLQLARLRDVRVVATASPASFDRVRAFGGTPVAYGAGLIERLRNAAEEGGFAAALDAAGTPEAIDASVTLVADRDRIVTVVGGESARTAGIRMIAGRMPASAAFRDGVRSELVAMAARGDLVVPMAATYPLDEMHEAMRRLTSGHPGGKIALIP